MHRSGTSALTRCLSFLGLTLGREDHLIPPGADNPRGFWENAGLSQFNEKILETLGGTWFDPPYLRSDWRRRPELDELKVRARELLAGEGLGGPTACWKDPRSCLTLPFWLELLPEPPAIIFIHRDPLEIWRSLQKRNGFDKPTALALWAVYTHAALRHLTDLPLFTLSYENLLQEPLAWLGRIRAFLEKHGQTHLHAPSTQAVQEFLSTELRNWRSRPDEFAQDAAVTPLQRNLLQELARLPRESGRFKIPAPPEPADLFECHAVVSRARVAALQAEIEKAREYQGRLEGGISTARAYQENLEKEIELARVYQANLEQAIEESRRRTARLLLPLVDVMVVNYNGRRWIDGFFESLRRASYPAERLRLVFVDNASADDSFEYARQQAANLPFAVEFVQTGSNAGFTGGYAAAFRCGEGRYYFVVNTDTEMAPDAIERLVAVLEADPKVGIAEARQSPLEHPKYYDPITRETSWCSGACMMVRSSALRTIGGDFDLRFFMYAEDVDLSWRMWLHGYKCVYVPEAVVQHFTEHLDPNRDHSIQHYFSMRNGAMMRVIYGSRTEIILHYLAMLRVGTFSQNPRRHKLLTLKAAAMSLTRLPSALRKRRQLKRLGRHPWVLFDGWLYGRHWRDPAADSAADLQTSHDLWNAYPAARRRLARDLSVEDHIVRIPNVTLGAVAKPAILTYDTGEIAYELDVPADAVLVGFIGAPSDVWKPTAEGQFELEQDDEVVWREELRLENLSHRRWVPFEAALKPSGKTRKSTLTLRFNGRRDLVWGLWGGVRLGLVDRSTERDDPVERMTGLTASVVIPTHNRADRIDRVIRRLMAQDIPPERFEVILVDSNSRDHTPDAAARLSRLYANLTALRSDKPGAAAARNLGINAARAPLVILLDDDILVGRDFLRRILRAQAKHPDGVLLGRIVAPWDGSADPFHRYLLQAQDVNIYDFPDPTHVPANYFYTACVTVPRSVLGDTRFDEGFCVYGVEDIEFGFRLLGSDTRMVFLPNLQVLHDYYPSYWAYRRKKHKAGYSLGYFLAQHPQHAHRFQFGDRFRKYYHLLRLGRILGAPVAGLLYLLERISNRQGPVNRWLYRWLYVDLRIQLYSGLLRYRRGAKPPA